MLQFEDLKLEHHHFPDSTLRMTPTKHKFTCCGRSITLTILQRLWPSDDATGQNGYGAVVAQRGVPTIVIIWCYYCSPSLTFIWSDWSFLQSLKIFMSSVRVPRGNKASRVEAPTSGDPDMMRTSNRHRVQDSDKRRWGANPRSGCSAACFHEGIPFSLVPPV